MNQTHKRPPKTMYPTKKVKKIRLAEESENANEIISSKEHKTIHVTHCDYIFLNNPDINSGSSGTYGEIHLIQELLDGHFIDHDIYIYNQYYTKGSKFILKITKDKYDILHDHCHSYIMELHILSILKYCPYIITMYNFGINSELINGQNTPEIPMNDITEDIQIASLPQEKILILERGDFTLTEYIYKLHNTCTMDAKIDLKRVNMTIKHIVYQIILGLQALNIEGISHRDLKPDNIVLNQNLEPKLIDFGLGNTLNFISKPLSCNVATIWYRPPELIIINLLHNYGYMSDNVHPYNSMKVDIWSMGIILLDMFAPGHNILRHYNEIGQMMEYIQWFGQRNLCYDNTVKTSYNTLLSNDIKFYNHGQSYIQGNHSLFHHLRPNNTVHSSIANSNTDRNNKLKNYIHTVITNSIGRNSTKQCNLLVDLICHMLEPDPAMRYGINDILQHSYFNDIAQQYIPKYLYINQSRRILPENYNNLPIIIVSEYQYVLGILLKIKRLYSLPIKLFLYCIYLYKYIVFYHYKNYIGKEDNLLLVGYICLHFTNLLYRPMHMKNFSIRHILRFIANKSYTYDTALIEAKNLLLYVHGDLRPLYPYYISIEKITTTYHFDTFVLLEILDPIYTDIDKRIIDTHHICCVTTDTTGEIYLEKYKHLSDTLKQQLISLYPYLRLLS